MDLSFKIQDAIEDILTTPFAEGQYAKELKITQEVYQNCLSANLYPNQKSEVYLNVLKSIGGFPAIDNNWQSANFSWFNMSSHLARYGIDNFVHEEIIAEYPFPPFFTLPDLGLEIIINSHNIDYNNSEAVIKNRQHMEKLLETYEVEDSKINKTIDDIFTFFKSVIDLSLVFDNDLETCQNMTENMTETFHDWENYYDIAWLGTHFEYSLAEYCPCEYFYTELDKICNQNKEAVANYLALKFLFSMHANLESQDFQREYCLSTIRQNLPFVVDYFYMQRHFNFELQQEVASVVEKIRENLKITLENADWLDAETRKEALLKESTLTLRIGNYNDANITDQVICGINNVNLSKTNFDENLVNLRNFAARTKRYLGINHKNISNTTKPLELMLGATVNAFYYSDDNSINVMAGVLHPPTYHSSWPDSLKYGTLGYLVGHELTHSTDSPYDSAGKMRNWWTNKTKSVYNKRSQCFVDHFDKYLIPEIDVHVDGSITKTENIADDGGLRQALSAYRREQKLKLKESDNADFNKLNDQIMPGLDLSSEQLFYLGFAQLWCSVYNKAHFWEEQKNDHTIDRYRVLGALSNNEDFSQAFNCPVGSQMNPNKTKCRIF